MLLSILEPWTIWSIPYANPIHLTSCNRIHNPSFILDDTEKKLLDVPTIYLSFHYLHQFILTYICDDILVIFFGTVVC